MGVLIRSLDPSQLPVPLIQLCQPLELAPLGSILRDYVEALGRLPDDRGYSRAVYSKWKNPSKVCRAE